MTLTAAAASAAVLLATVQSATPPASPRLVVRIAELEIDPAQIYAFRAILAEEQEASVRLEPGVLMLHSVAMADEPTHIRLLEVYADREAYSAHIKSSHFVRYKTASATMVRSLRLIETTPILLCAKATGRPSDPVACF